jgi:uncharacterized SAM-binding protein YcdF (DUF218 family)
MSFLAVILIGIFYLLVAIYVGNVANKDTRSKSDVILVLGAKTLYGNTYNSCLVSRVTHAVDLYKAKYAPKILFSGGTDREDNINEAKTMKKLAIALGVPSEDILLETRSTSTYENILFSQKILRSLHLKSVILVTDPFHSARAELVSKKLGLSFGISPAATSICWLDFKYFSPFFLKEPIAIIKYKLENKL